MSTKIFQKIFILLLTSILTTTLFAGTIKGQKLYLRELKTTCGFNSAIMSQKHTQAEWKKFFDAGKLLEEIQTLCPKVEKLKTKDLKHLYFFFYEFANDSGKTPNC
ncbi:MAG: cytochrome C [Helicobacteraceae bacterium]|nr:cytochrome C [Helicobacteraceae bacterium]